MAETIKYRVCYAVPGYIDYYKHKYFKTREAAEAFNAKQCFRGFPIIPIRSRLKRS